MCSVPAILGRTRGPRGHEAQRLDKCAKAQGIWIPIAKDESNSALAPDVPSLEPRQLNLITSGSEGADGEAHERAWGAKPKQSRTVRMQESMPGTGPRACLAPLPCTLFGNHHVVFRHVSLRCYRQVLKHRSYEEG